MKKYFRYVDRRVAVVLVILFVALLVLNRTWVRSVSGGLDKARGEFGAAQVELADLRARLVDTRTQGITGVEALRGRVERLESLVPFGINDTSVTRDFVAIAESSGVQLDAFEQAPLPTTKNSGSSAVTAASPSGLRIEGMRPFVYRFKVTGPYLAITSFLNEVMGSDSFTVTLEGFALFSVSDSENPDLFSEAGTLEGTLSIWTMLERPLGSGVAASDAPAADTPSTEPPAADTPSTEPPVADTPSTEPPAADTPSTEPAPGL